MRKCFAKSQRAMITKGIFDKYVTRSDIHPILFYKKQATLSKKFLSTKKAGCVRNRNKNAGTRNL